MNVYRRATAVVLSALLILALAVPAAFGAPVQPPRRPLWNSYSTNWSGYAAETSLTAPSTGVVTDVVGTWQVPFVTGSLNAWSSAWVGIDGYSSSSVEQIGTEQDTTKRGGTRYYAWYEMYPAPSVYIAGFPVNPGNIITGEVKYVGSNQYELSLDNISTGLSYQTTQTATADRSSAEWIMEAPSSGRILPLADFGVVQFSNCGATITSTTGPISTWPNDPMTMVSGSTRKFVTKAAPSGLTNSGADFTVTWYHK